MVGAGFISHCILNTHHRTASQLIFLREAARTAANCAQPIILALRNLRLSESLPPFGRRVAAADCALSVDLSL